MTKAEQYPPQGVAKVSHCRKQSITPRAGVIARALLLLGLACGSILSSLAQSSSKIIKVPTASPEQLARNANQEAALAALKNGDIGGALEKLAGNIRREAGAPHEDLQLGFELANVACQLKAQRDAATLQRAVTTAASVLSRSRFQMTAKDANASRLLEAQIYDHIVADRTRAIAAYEAALVADPAARSASERLTHLKAIEELARRKTAANDLLRARIPQPKR